MPPLSEQDRHLLIVQRIGIALALALVIVGWVLYDGVETPPGGMNVQAHDATGYQPPPNAGTPAGSVPRTGVEHVLPPATPNGSVPAEAVGLRNPLGVGPETVALGAMAYKTNCAMCHGNAGKGDGPVSDSYQPRAPDLTTPAVSAETDGALFYKITNGIVSTPIPEAAKYLPREWHAWPTDMTTRERWATVSYLRRLEARHAAVR